MLLAAFVQILVVGTPGAQAKPLKLAIQRVGSNAVASSASGSTIAVKVSGAWHASSVALYVDGRLRGTDRSWPWRFRRAAQIPLKIGHHQIAARARLRHRSQVRHRNVTVAYRSSRGGPKASKNPTRTSSSGSTSPAPVSSASSEPLGQSVTWGGGYETGDLSQWDLVQQVAPDRISLVHDPVRQGQYAARYEVRPGDNIGNTSTRAEVGKYLGEHEGEERYYRWYTYFDPSFPTNYPEEFVTFTQWRAEDESESLGSFMVWGNQIELRRDGTRWSTPIQKGVWNKFVYHVKWSPDPNVGFIELWYNDQLVLPRVNVRTMAGPGIGNYVKQGLYKSDKIPTAVLYQDGFVSGTSYSAVSEAP